MSEYAGEGPDPDDWLEAHIAHKDDTIARLTAERDALTHLCRWLCNTYTAIDKWARTNDGDLLMTYPVVQGIGNQMALRRIGEQAFNVDQVAGALAASTEERR